MKQEDFERLKAKLGDEFEIIQDALVEIDGTIAFVRKKDPWDGVEFFFSSWSGKIFRRDHIDAIDIENHNEHLSPSTEQAYKEQLKKESFERFGEIKEGDRFDRTGVSVYFGEIKIQYNPNESGFRYEKKTDRLFFNGLLIYRLGKWATRVKERVKITPLTSELSNGVDYCFKAKTSIPTSLKLGLGQFLASQLEKYLNGEV